MAERRMFSKSVLDCDKYIDLPPAAQALYIYIAMHADDDGFLNNASGLRRLLGFGEEVMQVLFDNGFLLRFDSGVVVIRHWKIHNYIPKNRYKPTMFVREFNMLVLDEQNVYHLVDSLSTQNASEECKCVDNLSTQNASEECKCVDNLSTQNASEECKCVDTLSTQDRIGKDRVGKVSIGEEESETEISSSAPSDTDISSPPPPTKEEIAAYATAEGLTHVDIDRFFKYYSESGWRATTGSPIRWRSKLRDWDIEDQKRPPAPSRPPSRSSPSSSPSQKEQQGSFDTDDFFQAALARSYRDMGKDGVSIW